MLRFSILDSDDIYTSLLAPASALTIESHAIPISAGSC